MRGTVKIGSVEVGMLANAASPVIYKQIFKEDFLKIMNELQTAGNEVEGVNLFGKMGFVMAMQDSKRLEELMSVSFNDYVKWLTQFEPNDLLMAAVDIATLYNKQETALSKEKKEEG